MAQSIGRRYDTCTAGPETVLFATHYAGLGGGETSLLNLLAALRAGGNRVLLACPPGELQVRAQEFGVRVIPVGLRLVRRVGRVGVPILNPLTIFRLAAVIRRERVTAVQAESFPALCLLGPAARLVGVPCMATGHGYWPLRHRPVQWLLPHLADRLHAVSRGIAAELSAVVGPDRVQVVPLGVGAEFLTDGPDRAEARRRLGLPADEKIVLNVARYEPIKGHEHLLDALELLSARGIRPLTLLAGGLLEPAGPTARACRQRVADRARGPQPAGRVRLLGPRTDIALLMRAADVLVVPSRRESFGMTVIEAMAVGTPVIATRCGGPEELLRDQETGRLVPRDDAAALAGAVSELLAQPDRAAMVAARARQTVRECYGPERRAAVLLDELSRLRRRPNARRLPAGKRPGARSSADCRNGAGTESPGVSLVFTVKNEADSLPGFLAGVSAQVRLPDEVVVTDGGSDDGTFELLHEWAAGFPRPVTLRRAEGNIACGRNLAVGLARYGIIACTDAGCELPADWLARIVAPLESDPELDVAAGAYRAEGRNLFERCAAAVTCPTRAIRPDRYLPSARSLAFRRRAWHRVGGFPEELDYAEDTVFDLRLKRAGCRFRYCPEASVRWRPRGSLAAIARQFRNYARGDAIAGIRNSSYFRLYARWFAAAAALGAGLWNPGFLALWGLAVVPYWAVWLRLRDWHRTGNWRSLLIVPVQKLTVDLAAMLGWLEGRLQRNATMGHRADRTDRAGGRVPGLLLVGSRNLAEPGGEQRLVAGRAEALWKQTGITTHALVVRPGRTVTQKVNPGFTVETCGAGGFFGWPGAFLRLAARAREMARETKRPGALSSAQSAVRTPGFWVGLIVSGLGGYPMLPLLRRWYPGLPVIADVHGAREEWLEYPPPGLMRSGLLKPAYHLSRLLERAALRRCDAVLSVSEELTGHLRAGYGPLRAIRIPCGVAGARGSAPGDDSAVRSWMRRQLGLDGRTVFVFCGRLSGWQCFRESVALWQAWRGREPHAALLVVTPDREAALRQLESEPGCFRVVSAQADEVAELLSAADIGLLLRARNITNHVAFPNKFAEYLQAGLVVVTSPGLTGVARLVREYGLGVVLEPEQACCPGRSFERKLASLLSRRVRRTEYRIKAQQAVARFADMDSAVRDLARFIARGNPRAMSGRVRKELLCASFMR